CGSLLFPRSIRMAVHFRVIRGEYIIVGKQPDGDSIRFKADDVTKFDHLPGGGHVKITPSDQTAQLRFQGIDAPELHYMGESQPMGRASRDLLLNELDFGMVTYNGLTVATAERRARGAILTRQAEQHGRPIAYLFWRQDAEPLQDGAMIEA